MLGQRTRQEAFEEHQFLCSRYGVVSGLLLGRSIPVRGCDVPFPEVGGGGVVWVPEEDYGGGVQGLVVIFFLVGNICVAMLMDGGEESLVGD